jgi:hypothetical protein
MPSTLEEADSGAASRCLQSLIIRGGEALYVQVSLPASGGQGPTSIMAEVGRIAPEMPGERSTAIVLAGKSGPAPESAERQGPASESVGAKRAVLEHGSSDRPAKRT